MSLVSEAYSLLNAETSDDLSKWLGEDGHKQLVKFSDFFADGGVKEQLDFQMARAIREPSAERGMILFSQIQKELISGGEEEE